MLGSFGDGRRAAAHAAVACRAQGGTYARSFRSHHSASLGVGRRSVHRQPPAFVAACPCPGQAPFLTFAGTARIGTVQRLSVQSQLCHPAAGYFIIGLPLSVPIPIPSGLVVCDGDMTPVSTLSIDPIFVTRTFPALPDASGCSSQFLPYFLFIPNKRASLGSRSTRSSSSSWMAIPTRGCPSRPAWWLASLTSRSSLRPLLARSSRCRRPLPASLEQRDAPASGRGPRGRRGVGNESLGAAARLPTRAAATEVLSGRRMRGCSRLSRAGAHRNDAQATPKAHHTGGPSSRPPKSP